VRQLAAAFLLRACSRLTCPSAALQRTASKLVPPCGKSGSKLPHSRDESALYLLRPAKPAKRQQVREGAPEEQDEQACALGR
jgi:hypothetical protein